MGDSPVYHYGRGEGLASEEKCQQANEANDTDDEETSL